MGDLDNDTEGLDDPLLRALARTPPVAPFSGTDRYRVCACLGEGGFGVVYEVEDVELGRRVALKTLKPHPAGAGANIARLKREFRSVADLVHRNLVGLHELATDGRRWFFTMDLVRGSDFLDHVRGGEARLRDGLRQLVAGVTALHQAGIVHRDLKPSNVLVEVDGRVVVLDFGLASSDQRGDRDIAHAGTPVYMAPEQARGGPVTAAADWYAVGVMLYEALGATLPPVPGAAAIERGAGGAPVPPDLERLCLAMLDPEPSARPDAAAIAAALGARPADLPRAAGGAVFVGRRSELEALHAAFAALERGEPGLVRIHGQPGVGKSALLARFGEEVGGQGRGLVLAGRCHERESVPFKAFDGIADALVRHLQSLPPGRAAALLPRDIHLVSHLFPVFDQLVGGESGRAAHPADPREERQRAFAAIKELVQRIGVGRPLVIAIDDMQWGDVDSARLLSHLIGPPDRPRFLLLLSFRADDAGTSAALIETARLLEAAGERGRAIAVEPLPASDAEALAAALLGEEARPSAAARVIAQRGEGHPLFMAELARAVDSRPETAGAPPTLMDILWQRVLRLPAAARALVETVAVAGRPLPGALCFAAAGLDGAGVDAMRLLRAELLLTSGERGELSVFHDRVRDAILARADQATQRERHLGLARSLERARDSDAEALARHYEAAGEGEQAARHAVRAADGAMRALAFDRAAALYRMAIELGAGPALELNEKLAHALLNAGHSTAAGEAFMAASRCPGASREQVTDLARLAAEHLLLVGNHQAGYECLGQALASVGESLPATPLRAMLKIVGHTVLVRLRRTRFRERDEATIPREQLLRLDVLDSASKGLDPHDPARAIATRARFYRLALKTGEPRRAALALSGAIYGIVGYQKSRPPLADELLDAAEAIGRRLSDPGVVARVIIMRGLSYQVFADWGRAAALFDQAAALIAEECVGMANEHHFALINAAECYLQCGSLGRAQRIGEAVLHDALERGDEPATKHVSVGIMAAMSLAADDPDRADKHVWRVEGEDRCVSLMFRAESGGQVAMYRGEPLAAVEGWRARWSEILRMHVLAVPAFRTITVRSLGMALLAGAPTRRERREVSRLARSIRGLRLPFARAVDRSLRAYLALRDGDLDRGRALLAATAEQLDASGMPLDAMACRYRLAQLGGEADPSAALAGLRAGGIADPERWSAMRFPAIG